MERYDVVVIGQGYAGLAAAKLAIGHGLSTANIESNCMGGLILNLNELHPAPEGLEGGGAEIASNMLMANMDSGVESVMSAVTEIRRGPDGLWTVATEEGNYNARNVVVASGARLRKLGVPGEETYFGMGVSECADCDGPMFQGMPTVVIGGGDSAFQEAAALAQFADKVTIVMRGAGPRARADLREAVAANPKIELLPRTRVTEILGAAGSGVTGVTIATEGEAPRQLPCQGVFIFVGLEPSTDFVPAEIARDAGNALIVDDNLATGQSGIWAIGAARSGFGGRLTDADADAAKVVSAITAA